MKKKILIIFLFIIFALPIPIAMLGSLMSFLWLVSSLIKPSSLVEIIMALAGVLIGAAYLFTYIYSLNKTWNEKKFSVKTFMPIGHCLIAFVFLLLLAPTENYVSESQEYFGFAKKDFLAVEELDT